MPSCDPKPAFWTGRLERHLELLGPAALAGEQDEVTRQHGFVLTAMKLLQQALAGGDRVRRLLGLPEPAAA